MPLPLVWLDGRLLPLAEARISPLDRGFLFSLRRTTRALNR